MARAIASLCAAVALAACGGPADDEELGVYTAQQALQPTGGMTISTPAQLAQSPTSAADLVRLRPAPRPEERFYAPQFPLPCTPP